MAFGYSFFLRRFGLLIVVDRLDLKWVVLKTLCLAFSLDFFLARMRGSQEAARESPTTSRAEVAPTAPSTSPRTTSRRRRPSPTLCGAGATRPSSLRVCPEGIQSSTSASVSISLSSKGIPCALSAGGRLLPLTVPPMATTSVCSYSAPTDQTSSATSLQMLSTEGLLLHRGRRSWSPRLRSAAFRKTESEQLSERERRLLLLSRFFAVGKLRDGRGLFTSDRV